MQLYKTTMMCAVVFLLIVTRVMMSTVNASVTYDVCYGESDDIILINTVFGDCMDMCEARHVCVSINYHPKMHICVLHSSKAIKVQCHVLGVVFAMKLDWIQPPLPEPCGTCEIHQACLFDTTVDAFQCSYAECGPALEPMYGRVLGNKQSVGSEVAYTCYEGFKVSPSRSSTCLDSGEWSQQPECIADFNQICPTGWYGFGTSCYYFGLNVWVPFYDALAHCQSLHSRAHLLAIENSEEHEYINTTLNSLTNMELYSYGNLWYRLVSYGIYELDQEGQWRYLHSNSELTWNGWRDGEPNNLFFQDEKCGCLMTNDANYVWGQADCPCYYTEYEYVCELELEDMFS